MRSKNVQACPVRWLYEIIDKNDKPAFSKISTLESGFENMRFFSDGVQQIRACGRQARLGEKKSLFSEGNGICETRLILLRTILSRCKNLPIVSHGSCVRLKRCYGVWIGVVFSSFKQTSLGAGEMVRASFPFWSLRQSVSTCCNCFCPRLKIKKNVIIICGCYAILDPSAYGFGNAQKSSGSRWLLCLACSHMTRRSCWWSI